MRHRPPLRSGLLAAAFLTTLSACLGEPSTQPPNDDGFLIPLGLGAVSDRYTAEVWVRGNTGYTTTWGMRGPQAGNAIKIWDVTGNIPALVDSVIVPDAGTLGDVQVSDDGSLLVVAIEHRPHGGIGIYSLADPRKPQLVTRFTSSTLEQGVHTAEVARVNGKLYVFCAVDPAAGIPARLVIVDISMPATPVEVAELVIGAPFIHDVFVRDGLLFAAEWHQGLAIYDIGAEGGSPSDPRFMSRVHTVGGQVHNVWWFHDPANGSKRYAFVGEEGPSAIGWSAEGDLHVVDVSDLRNPHEVAYYRVPGAGAHNFSMDEANGILYAAFYNGGVRVLDVRGDLSSCADNQRDSDGRCRLQAMGRELAVQASNIPVYVWGVHFTGNAVYASDMLNGLYKFAPVRR